MLIILIYVFILGTIGLLAWGLSEYYVQREVRVKLSQAAFQSQKKKISFSLAKLFPFNRGLLEKLRLDIAIKNQLDAAHLKLTPLEFFNIKVLLMIVLGILSPSFTGQFNPLVFGVALAIGYAGPDIYLRKKISERKHAIARILPETVDLLGLCVEAGLDFTSAVRWVIDKASYNPMVEELTFVLEEIKWGKPRVQALKDMAKRLNVPEVSSFVQTLVQAERMGTPVAEAFTILSEDTRLQRFHRGERVAMQAPIKILIPLIFCILPVIAIIIGAPIFLQFMQGGLLKGLG